MEKEAEEWASGLLDRECALGGRQRCPLRGREGGNRGKEIKGLRSDKANTSWAFFRQMLKYLKHKFSDNVFWVLKN